MRARDWGKAAGVELLAGFGPTALLLFFLRAGGHTRGAEAPQPLPLPALQTKSRQKTPQAPVEPISKASETTTATIPTPLNDPLHSFIARRLERYEGEMVGAGNVWLLWKEDCEDHGIEPGTQQAFGRNFKKWFAHEKNNGRPRYLNVRIKPESAPALRLAVVNS